MIHRAPGLTPTASDRMTASISAATSAALGAHPVGFASLKPTAKAEARWTRGGDGGEGVQEPRTSQAVEGDRHVARGREEVLRAGEEDLCRGEAAGEDHGGERYRAARASVRARDTCYNRVAAAP